MAIASLVLGILGVIPIPIPFIGTASAIVGIILGILGKKKLAEEGSPTGVATAGIVLSIIGLVFSIIWLIVCSACAAASVGGLNAFANELNNLTI